MITKRYSIFFTLFISISLALIVSILIVSKILYDEAKSHLLQELDTNAKTSLVQLSNSISPFMESYSIGEYEKLIEHEFNRKNILAIIVEDYNMEKVVGSQYIVAKIIPNKNIEDYDIKNELHQQKIKNAYNHIKDKIENSDGLQLGSISIYVSDSLVQKELAYFIEISIFFILFSATIILLVIYFVIKKIIQNPLSNMIEIINDKTDTGIPKNLLPVYNSKELAIFSSTLNNMIGSIKESRYQLDKHIAFLRSYQLAIDESSIVTKSDLKGTITYANQKFYDITGFTPEEVIGKPHNIVRHPDVPKESYKELWDTIRSKRVWKGTLKNTGKLNDYWIDSTILPILDENSNIVEYVAVRYDITQRIKQQEQLNKTANTDMLTNLGSRYKLIQDMKGSLNPALAIINIDSFSELNDLYGYRVGDHIIKEVSVNISELFDCVHSDVYHLQGDEYVLFSNDVDKDTFEQKINHLRLALTNIPIKVNDELLNFNYTIGISFENEENLLSTADMALKIAKRNSKDVIVFSESISLNKEYENNIYWTKKIKTALEDDRFIPVYQAIVNNKTKKIEKYEALVRLEDDDKLISPFYFLEISKKTKYYTAITKIMIEKSFEKFKDSRKEFSINLTIEDILNKEIQSYLFMILSKYNIGSRVVLEIVESESIQNFEAVLNFIYKAKELGCRIAIDDFGTGYSNFEYLMKLNADYIKIDGSLIQGIDTNKQAQVVVSTIVDFAKKMSMKTIAEFVENENILNKVIELDIDYSQGYFFSEPKTTIEI